MKAQTLPAVRCPECAKLLGPLAGEMKRDVHPEESGTIVVYCDTYGCPLYHKLYRLPFIDLEEVEA